MVARRAPGTHKRVPGIGVCPRTVLTSLHRLDSSHAVQRRTAITSVLVHNAMEHLTPADIILGPHRAWSIPLQNTELHFVPALFCRAGRQIDKWRFEFALRFHRACVRQPTHRKSAARWYRPVVFSVVCIGFGSRHFRENNDQGTSNMDASIKRSTMTFRPENRAS